MIFPSSKKIGNGDREKVSALINERGLGVLSTKDEDGHPYSSLIAFACNPDNSELYFVTPKETRKYTNLCRDGRVALLVNDCINDPSDFHKASAVTVLGKAASVVEGDKEEVLKIYLQKHPYLEQFARSSSSAVMTIQVTGLAMSLRFQNPHLLADGYAI